MYSNFIFDLYGTLIDINTDESIKLLWEKMALIYGYNGAIYTPEEFKEQYFEIAQSEEDKIAENNNSGSFKKSDTHESHPEIQLEYVFQKLFQNKGIFADMQLCIYVGQFFRALSTKYISLYDGAKELLIDIKEHGGKVYLLSNAQKVFTEYELKMVGIYDLFDDIFISSDYLCRKPDVRFINKLIMKHNIKIKESIMIGNDLSTDVASAKAVNMDTLYIYSNLSPRNDEKNLNKADVTYLIKEMNLSKVRNILLHNEDIKKIG